MVLQEMINDQFLCLLYACLDSFEAARSLSFKVDGNELPRAFCGEVCNCGGILSGEMAMSLRQICDEDPGTHLLLTSATIAILVPIIGSSCMSQHCVSSLIRWVHEYAVAMSAGTYERKR